MTNDPINPWLTRPGQPPLSAIPDTAPAPPVVPTGPVEPQPGAVPQPLTDGLPIAHPVAAPATWWWLGCHGGAGVSTVQTALGEGLDAQRWWPGPGGTPHRVVLVARSHAHGLRSAQTAIRQWASGSVTGVQLLGLVVVADAPGRQPAPLRDLGRLVSGGVPRTWTIPWVEPWRQGEPATSHRPRQVNHLARNLMSLIESRT